MTIQSVNSPGPTPPPRPLTPAQQEAANRELAEIAGSTAAGAAIGSIVPGLGTALGAGIGFGFGVLNAMIDAAMTPQEQAPPGSDFPEQLPELPPMQGDGQSLVGDRKQAIAQMYRDLLGREPEDAGLNGWTESNLSLDDVRIGIANSPEGQRVARIRNEVLGITGRGATNEEIAWFQKQIDTPGTTFEGISANYKDILAENARKAQEQQAAMQPMQQVLTLWREEVGADYSGDGQFLNALADELKRTNDTGDLRGRIRQAAIERVASGSMPLPAGSKITPEDVVSQIFTDLTGQNINHAGAGPGPLAQRYREGLSFSEIRAQMEEIQNYRKEKYGG